MTEIEEIKQALLQFRNERDWEQFHNAKDLALAINIESSELLEQYLWKSAEDANPQKVKEELADIFKKMLKNIPLKKQKDQQKNTMNYERRF